MSAVMPTPERSPSATLSPAARSSRAAAKPKRVLACVLCQQRKVKCDRKFPCANCVRACAQCVPAALAPRQRRRRFPERELLERLRRYEDLLRRSNIKFEPLHPVAVEKASPSEDGRGSDSADDARSERPATGADRPPVKSKTVIQAKNPCHAPNERFFPEDVDDENDGDEDDNDSRFPHDDVRDAVREKVYDHLHESNDYLLFGSSKTNVDLSTLHPDQVQIFRLWQIYLENVNPLLKVTHTPTLQARFIDAASDLKNINPTLEALMFSIYCVSILSLAEDECRTLFKSLRKDLLRGYQFGCQQALLNCEVLRTGDRDCLTALYLYLVSFRQDADPRPLSSVLGVSIRIAQRMGIHNESTHAKCTALEAEMRRRLWWSLVIFDHRISELSDYKANMLTPIWDCRTPLNVNDFDIRPEMNTAPVAHERPTEALFAIVRGKLGEFVRHSAFHLDLTNPSSKSITKNTQHSQVPESDDPDALEKTIEGNYLKFCNPENPLHFMTIWTARGQLAKTRIMDHYSRSSVQQTSTQQEAAISHALSMLECDTKLMTSPLTKGYLWFINMYFPFPAYIHLVQVLRKRPIEEYAEKCWGSMSDNYEARFMKNEEEDTFFFKTFSNNVLQAWEARDAAFRELNKPIEPPPRMVSDIKQKVMQMTSNARNNDTEQPNSAVHINIDDFSMLTPTDFGGHGLPNDIGALGSAGSGPEGYPSIAIDVDMNRLDWTMLNWNPMYARGW